MKTSKTLTFILIICLLATLVFALASCSSEDAETEITSVTVKKDKENIVIKATLDDVYSENHAKETLYVLALPTADTSYVPTDVDIVGEVKVKSSIKLSFSLTDDNGFSRLTKAFVLAEKTDLSYAPITNAMYVQNPEILADEKSDAPDVSDIKGLNSADIYDAHLAGADRMLFVADMNALMLDEYKDGAVKYNKDGVSYFFDDDAVSALDEKVKNANDLGMRVYLRTICYEYELDAEDSSLDLELMAATTPLVSDEYLARKISAFYCFLAQRYSGEYGQVSDYIIGQNGNKVLLSSEEAQEKAYQAWVRLAHISLRSIDANSRVYVSVSNKWRNSGTGVVGAKSFLSHFAEQAKNSGDYDWSISLDLGNGDDLPALLATDSYDYSNIGVDNMNEVIDLINTADMRYQSEKRGFIIDALALPTTISESNRATYYICAYYKAAALGAEAFFYTDRAPYSLLDQNENRGALYYMFLLCGTDKTGQLTEYTRKVEGFTDEEMQKHVFKKMTFLQNAKYEISEKDEKRTAQFPATFGDFEENAITYAQLSLVDKMGGGYGRVLNIRSYTENGIGAVTAFEVSAKQIKASKYIGVTASSENSPMLVLAISSDSKSEVVYIVQAQLVNGESEYYFDLSEFSENVGGDDKLTISLCLLSDDAESNVTVSDITLYGNSGFDATTVIIIVAVAVVAAGLVAAIIVLALKRKKKMNQD